VPADAFRLQGIDFGQRFLEAIFSDNCQSRADGFSNTDDRHRLAGAHQPHITVISAGLMRRAPNAIEDEYETISDRSARLDIHAA
jgi:hypothetical protein